MKEIGETSVLGGDEKVRRPSHHPVNDQPSLPPRQSREEEKRRLHASSDKKSRDSSVVVSSSHQQSTIRQPNFTSVVDVDELIGDMRRQNEFSKARNFLDVDVDEFIRLAATQTHERRMPAIMPLPEEDNNNSPPREALPGAFPQRGPGYSAGNRDSDAISLYTHDVEEEDDEEEELSPSPSPWVGGGGDSDGDITLRDNSHSNNNLHSSLGDMSGPSPFPLEDGLVEASPVEEPSTQFMVITQEATQVDDLEAQQKRTTTRKEQAETKTKNQLLLLALIVGLLVVGIVVAVLVTSSSDSSEASVVTENNATSPMEEEFDVLPIISPYLSNLTLFVIERERDMITGFNASALSPQYRAYQWLQADPWKQNYTTARLVQRFALATFYYSTNGDNWIKNGVGGMEVVDFREFDTPRLQDNLVRPPPRRGPPPAAGGGGGGGPPAGGSGGGPPPAGGGGDGGPPPQGGGGGDGGPPPQGGGGGDGGPPPQGGGTGGGGPPPQGGTGGGNGGGPPPNSGGQRSRELQTNFMTLTVPSEQWLSYNTSECLWFTYTPFRFQSACNDEEVFQYLDLPSNGLRGSIPEEIGLLTGLQMLFFLRNRDISGPLPTHIGSLQRLSSLDLTDNEVTGRIPSEIGLLPNLTKLALLNNRLTGTLPTELLQIRTLKYLALDRNDLIGNFASLGNDTCQSWPGLRAVMLGRNKMEGPLPTFTGCSRLAAILLDSQGIVGTIPTEWASLESLARILLHDNDGIVGTIPSKLGSVTQFLEFKIDGTSITGTVPEELCFNASSGKAIAEFDCSDQLCGCDCPCG